MPTISVVVPVYNVEPFLDECVSSILSQTFSDFELILVDDGSPDNCPQMCDAWAEKDERIKVIHKKNGGLADARNFGIRAASGKYIAFVDSDDWVERQFLSTLYEGAISGDYDMVQCNFQRIYEDGTLCANTFPAAVYDRDYIVNILMPDMLNDRLTQIHCSRCNKLYKSEIVKQAIDLCDASIVMAEDHLLNFACLGLYQSIRCLDTPCLYNYRANSQSMTARYSSKNKYGKAAFFRNLNEIAIHFGCSEIPDPTEKTQKRWMYYIYECAISDWSRKDKKREIQEIVSMLDKKLWRSAIRTYDTPAKRVCMIMCYFHLISPMLFLVDVMKKIKGIE